MTGPVQILVIGLDEPTFSGEVMAEFARLREAGTVRLLDVVLIRRADDGTLETLPLPASAPAGMGQLAARLLGDPDSDEVSAQQALTGATWSLADAIPDRTALVSGDTQAVARTRSTASCWKRCLYTATIARTYMPGSSS